LKKLGVTLYVNPDGHEWKRAKWNAFIRKYWKESERLMIKHADLIICDSINIEKYIQSEYKNYNPKTTYISYGAEIKQKSKYISEKLNQWYKSFGIKQDNYYLSVGRFVPENNFETMIKEFMRSHSFKDYIIITNIDNEKYYKKLLANTQFMTDSRIKFVGSVYDQELLSEIRNNAYAYIHGHEVGGTNPSLLEALGSTKVNLLYNVDFNNEVAEDSAYYWTKSSGDLSDLINKIDKLTLDERNDLGRNANLQIEKRYNWNSVVDQYENVFLNGI
jgi:rhamnosyltransferase